MSLLDIPVQMEPPPTCMPLALASGHSPTALGYWHRGLHHQTPPGDRYWEWVSQTWHIVLIITAAWPPEPWIELQAEAVAHFGYLAKVLTHKCPGHPNKGPLYMALHALPSKLGPALQTHLREHFGGNATLRPHKAVTAAPQYMQPRSERASVGPL